MACWAVTFLLGLALGPIKLNRSLGGIQLSKLHTLVILLFSLSLIHCGAQNNSEQSASSVAVTSSSAAASSSQAPVAVARCSDSLAEQNKEAVFNALNGLFVQKNTSAIDQYWADPYLQHNPVAASGVATFKSFMAPFVTQSSFNYEMLRIYAECDLVVVQGRYSGTGLIFDMFRVANGKLVEHWDSDSNQSSTADGPSEVQDLAATHSNRETIDQLYAKGLIPNDQGIIAGYFANNAVIHRTNSNDFINHLTRSAIRYSEVHRVIADGNFVFVLAEAKLNGQSYALYDLYRLDEGVIVEHWDSRRKVPNSTASGLEIF